MELMFDRQLDYVLWFIFFFSSRRRHTRFDCDWSSDVCSSDLIFGGIPDGGGFQEGNQTANAQQSALGWTHTISPTLIKDRKSTRLNSSHSQISYAVFCLKKKKNTLAVKLRRPHEAVSVHRPTIDQRRDPRYDN